MLKTAHTAPPRVLIVDDEPANIQVLKAEELRVSTLGEALHPSPLRLGPPLRRRDLLPRSGIMHGRQRLQQRQPLLPGRVRAI